MRRLAGSLLLIALAVAVMALRQPAYLLEPGFFGEEGNVYFFRAWHQPWWRVLPDAPSGYLLLFTNVAAIVAAHVVPLARAPLVTTLFALAAQTAPVALVACGAAREWRSFPHRLVAVAILLFASLSDEIWLNTINSQCYFAVLAVLILLEPAELSRRRTYAYAGLLALAGSSGPVAAALAPLFAWKALLFRRRSAWVLAGVAAVGLAAQAVAVLATGGGRYISSRGSGAGVGSVAAMIWMRSIVLPLLGPTATERFAQGFLAWTHDDLASPKAIATGLVLLALAAGMVLWLGRGLDLRQRIALLCGYAVMAPLVTLLASGPQQAFLSAADHASRYFYAPGVVLLLILLENAVRPGERSRARRAVCAGLLAVALGLGGARYRDSVRWRPTWPRWRDQVAAWESDPHRALLIWPPGWQILFLVPARR